MVDLNHRKFQNKWCQACIERNEIKYGSFQCECDGIDVEYNVRHAIKSGIDEDTAREIYDTAYWFSKVYKSKPRSYQIPILLCTSRNLCSRQCRQSGKTLVMVMKIMHYVLTNDRATVLIVGPNDKVVKKIYDEYIWRDCINKSEQIKDSVKSKTQKPFYQVEFDNDSKVILMIANDGARSQCLPAGQMITMSDGSIKPIEKISLGEDVIAFNENTFKLSSEKVVDLISNGKKDLVKLKTETGKELISTYEHPVFSVDGWVEPEKINVGNYIATVKKSPFGKEILDDNVVKFIGYMIGDGGSSEKSIARGTVTFTNNNNKILDEFKEISTLLGFTANISYIKNGCENLRITSKHKCIPILNEYELSNKYSFEKYICDRIMQLNEKQLSLFLTRLYSTDGWASSSECLDKRRNKINIQNSIGYCSTSEKLAKQLQHILTKFGIFSRLSVSKKFLNGKQHRDQYKVTIRDRKNILLFFEKIGFIFGKEEACQKILNSISHIQTITNDNVLPINNLIYSELKRLGIKKQEIRIASGWQGQYLPNIETLKKINYILKSDIIEKYISGDVIFEKVVYKEILPAQETYNLTIENLHTFIVNDIITHNTANWLYIDEAAMVPREMLNSIIMTTGSVGDDAVIIETSTPRGRGDLFFQACKEDATFNEFHVPIHFIDEMKSQIPKFKRILGDTGFIQEAEAEFPDVAGGPFNYKGIDLAKHDYEYEACSRQDGLIYIGGVDWNGPTIGTFLYVISFDTSTYNITVVDKSIVASATWNSLVAKEELIRLNRKWNCTHWMVDYGYGHTITEELRSYSMQVSQNLGPNHPDSRIKHIIDTVEFGSLITLADPFTKEEIKKTTKSFIVQQVARLFEVRNDQVAITYSKHDADLTKSLENYKLLNTTARGYEQYGFLPGDGIEDHQIDALMLAIYGVVKYYSELFKRIIYQSVALGANAAFINTIVKPDIIDARGRDVVLISSNDDTPIHLDESKIRDPFDEISTLQSRTFGRSGAVNRTGEYSSYSLRNRSGAVIRTRM